MSQEKQYLLHIEDSRGREWELGPYNSEQLDTELALAHSQASCVSCRVSEYTE